MAEASCQNHCPDLDPEAKDKTESLECAVCLQPCVHPAQLPCGHIFCFLCVKGIANQSKKCAMCRQEIPRDFTEQPILLETAAVKESCEAFDEGYQWFYEGRNGWWQYDERTSKELEQAYKEGKRVCELLIAGFLYVVDLEYMVQTRRNDPSRRRRIKRDLATIPKKGIAGLRTGDSIDENLPQTRQTREADVSDGPQSRHARSESHEEQGLEEQLSSMHISVPTNRTEFFQNETETEDT